MRATACLSYLHARIRTVDAFRADSAPHSGMTGPRKLHIKSYGCQMNAYDSLRMADMLAPDGFSETSDVADADLVVLNTCHIREKAAEKVYSELGRLRVLKEDAAKAGRKVTIAVAGCVAQAEGAEIMRRAPTVDLVVGPQSYHRLPALLERADRGDRPVETEFPANDKFNFLKNPTREAMRARGVTAFLTIQEGCDKFCTFCVVPYTRGVEVSRPVSKIVAEAERLADAGIREITVIGQNVNAYHGAGAGRPQLHACTTVLSACGNPRHRPAALHHKPSAGRRRQPDRRASRVARTDAAAASAGAVGIRPHSRRDEPPPHPRRLSAGDRSATPREAVSGLHFGFYCRVSWRNRPGLRGYHGADRGRRLLRCILLQVFSAPGHTRRRDGRPGARDRDDRAPA